MKTIKSIITISILAVAMFSCNSGGGEKAEKIQLSGAGATFPLPFYNLAIKKYTEHTGVNISYGGIGSGGGIRSLSDQVVDYGATDAFLSNEKAADMPAEVVHIPTCIGAVVVAYNLPGIESLKLSNELMIDIFMGKITNWSDPKVAASNPGVEMPDKDITVVYRSDGSGTTYIFSDYLSKISTDWDSSIGKGKSLKWPTGIGAKGNPGVAGTISQTEGAVGYIGSEFALAQKIPSASIMNSSGNFVEPNIESISAAAKGEIPADTRVMLTNSSDPDAYPISGFTWLILYKEQSYQKRSMAQAEATLKYLDWMVSEEAQNLAPAVNYAPLPDAALELAKGILRTVKYDGATILK